MLRAPFQIRTYCRVPVQCTLYFSNDDLQGTGHIWNLSVDGCRVDGTVRVRQGMVFSLFLMLPGKQQAIIVDQAMVTWTRGREFGLRFSILQTPDATRLHQFVTARMN